MFTMGPPLWGGAEVDPYFSFVKLLLNGRTLDDTGPSRLTGTTHGATSLASPAKFGSTALKNSDGASASYISYPLALSSGNNQDRTIEWWQYAGTQPTNPTFWLTSGGGSYNVYCQYQNTGTHYFPQWNYRQSGQLNNAGDPTSGVWQFIVLQQRRSDTTIGIYIDGVFVASTSDASTWDALTTTSINITAGPTGAGFIGSMQLFRWTEGVARYSGSTCPVPTTFFPES